jgi:hypothetical protein
MAEARVLDKKRRGKTLLVHNSQDLVQVRHADRTAPQGPS